MEMDLRKMMHHGARPKIARSAYAAPGAVLVGEVTLGEGASVWFGAVLRGDINRIVVGNRSNVQDGCVLHVTEELPVEIDEDVTVGHGAILHGCRVGPRCLIAMRALVLDGAVIGEDSIIAAGALVPEGAQIPPRSVVMGVPGRVVREIRETELEHIRFLGESYVALAGTYLAEE
jgi:carbonic anhydrase/acetyltransferase-like protein (isoleucine patch superfamily)